MTTLLGGECWSMTGSRILEIGKEGNFSEGALEFRIHYSSNLSQSPRSLVGFPRKPTALGLSRTCGAQDFGCVPFDIMDNQGNIKREKGLYLIVDGGYHKWKCLQCPFKHTSKSAEALWSRWVESVRKDVECTFGILNGDEVEEIEPTHASLKATDRTFLS
jgi:Plant transposon protein